MSEVQYVLLFLFKGLELGNSSELFDVVLAKAIYDSRGGVVLLDEGYNMTISQANISSVFSFIE